MRHRDTHHHKGDVFRVEVTLNVPKKLIRVVEHREDAREAIDLITDKLLSGELTWEEYEASVM